MKTTYRRTKKLSRHAALLVLYGSTEAGGGQTVILFFIFHFSIHFFHFLIFTLPFSFLVEISVFTFYFSVFVFDFHFGKVKSGKVKNKNEITIWPPWTSVGFELS